MARNKDEGKNEDYIPEENRFYSARSYPVVVTDRIKGAVVVPDVTGYPDSKVEIVAPCNIRYTLMVNDVVLVKVKING